jgi:2-keto-4-pentenoate hydratase/2-oxohepta-3-ene-1,7-dioic acid hydratase in catechol pathway
MVNRHERNGGETSFAFAINLPYFTPSMKLVTYDAGNGPRAGVIVDGRVLDAGTLLAEQGGLRDVRGLLELPNDPLTRLKSALGSAHATQGVPLASVRLRAPIMQPPTVRDFMVYEGHASSGGTRQLSDAWYRMPIFYFSNPLCIFGPGDAVPYPSASQQFDYELELAAVIGREGSNVAESDGFSHIADFTIFNDWSCRDLQRDEMQARLGPAKGKDSATSLGPWIVTTDELASFIRGGRLHLRCTLKVNGVQWMENNAGIMHHTWGAMIERASRDSRIVPGDVLGSGTVTGGSIGEAIRNGFPARYLEPGDVVEIEVEGIGVLSNTIAPKVNPDLNYRLRAPPPGTPDLSR